jgi:hypothetical protein
MKKLIFLLAILVAPFFAMAQAGGKSPAFKWSETEHDFGKIKKGVPVTTTFTYTNIGKAPLSVSDVKASCGCTVPEYTKEVVAPGKTGTVKATYNAANVGTFLKSITVTSNVEGGPVILTIKGEVTEQ